MRSSGLTRLLKRRYWQVSLLLALAVLLFDGLTIRAGHNWDGDFALYIMQAQNIASGAPYTHTHYIFNKQNAIAPALYPPGLPLLLTPVYMLSGLNLEHMKWIGIVAWAGFVLVFAQVARRLLPASLALVAAALIAFHPFFWEFKDTIYAEFPFLMFTYGALYFGDRLIASPLGRENRERLLDSLAMAILVALAYLTRTVAVVLFPALLLSGIIHARRQLLHVVASLAAAILIIAAVSSLFPSDAATYISFFDQFSLRGVYWALRDYTFDTAILLQVEALKPSALQHACAIAYVALVAFGFATRARERLSVFEIFMASYVTLLLIFPLRYELERYSIPFWPLSLAYGLKGALALGEMLPGLKLRWHLPTAVATVLLVTFSIAYSHKSLAPLASSVTSPSAQELYDAILRNVPGGEVVLSRKPTVLALFTRRDSATWPRNFGDDREFWDYAHSIGAHYLSQDLGQEGDGAYDPNDRLDAFVRVNERLLKPVFSNDSFRLFRFE